MSIKLEDAIPHRPPFLLLDEIVAVEGKKIRALRRIPPDDPVLTGHFPGSPVWPGVLACESVFQAGAALLANILPQAPENSQPSVPVLTRIQGARFKKALRPGDLMEIEAELTETMGGAYFMRGTIRVGGKLAVDVEFACARVEAGRL